MVQSDVPEVRCERCQTSFAPETKQCVHCGGPLGRRQIFGGRKQQDDPAGGEMASPYEYDDESEELKLQSRGRNVVWILTAVLAMGMSLLRTCGGNG
ncbi:MAG: hypothetical protein JRG95_07540 [Deltaproteobacteria bacterium]|nr:hypothetical protein [Deltaproteobacteria bacterium]